MGGLSRRATVLSEKARGTYFVFEGGNWAWKSEHLPKARLGQQRLKGELQLKSLDKIGTDAIGLGFGDIALGLDWLTAQQAELSYPMVLSNLTCGELNLQLIGIGKA